MEEDPDEIREPERTSPRLTLDDEYSDIDEKPKDEVEHIREKGKWRYSSPFPLDANTNRC